MIYKLEMTAEEVELLIRLLANKIKEIHAWEAATNDQRRRQEYQNVQSLLKKIHTAEEAE